MRKSKNLETTEKGERIDTFLVKEGLVKSRTAASKMILRGLVSVDGKTVLKPSEKVFGKEKIVLSEFEELKYVSRGGLKLECALDEFCISVDGKRCIDIGASTGGFTDCLIKHGAKSVVCIDSGKGQLDESLKNNPKVVSYENFNAKNLSSEIGIFDVAVMDVSFISQTLLYGAVKNVLSDDGIFISLIKPQFEAGRENIGKGGIVKNDEARIKVIEKIRIKAKENGFRLIKTVPSKIKGGDGNEEYLALFDKIRYDK